MWYDLKEKLGNMFNLHTDQMVKCDEWKYTVILIISIVCLGLEPFAELQFAQGRMSQPTSAFWSLALTPWPCKNFVEKYCG